MPVYLPLLDGGVSAGQAEYEDLGLRIRVRCYLGRVELCKLALKRGGHTLLLGTPAPKGNGVFLERTLSCAELERAKVWPPERVEVFRGAIVAPELNDPVLRRIFSRKEWRWQRCGIGWIGVYPWRVGTEFPAMPILCLTQLEPAGDHWCVRCWLDGDGKPCFPLK